MKRHVCQYHKQYPNAPYDGCTCEQVPVVAQDSPTTTGGDYAETATEALFPESE